MKIRVCASTHWDASGAPPKESSSVSSNRSPWIVTGVSVESGVRIPDDRLEAEPLAERTVEEQARFERSQA